MTDLSIVIVSWNTKKYMEECLTSLCTIDGNLSAEIIVVDNASADGTPEMIRAQFPNVKLIETGANLGFARGNNVGIKEATGKYICLINSDVNVPSDCLDKMHSYMEQQPTIGLLVDSIFKKTGLFAGFLSYTVRAIGWALIFLAHQSTSTRARMQFKQYIRTLRWGLFSTHAEEFGEL